MRVPDSFYEGGFLPIRKSGLGWLPSRSMAGSFWMGVPESLAPRLLLTALETAGPSWVRVSCSWSPCPLMSPKTRRLLPTTLLPLPRRSQDPTQPCRRRPASFLFNILTPEAPLRELQGADRDTSRHPVTDEHFLETYRVLNSLGPKAIASRPFSFFCYEYQIDPITYRPSIHPSAFTTFSHS